MIGSTFTGKDSARRRHRQGHLQRWPRWTVTIAPLSATPRTVVAASYSDGRRRRRDRQQFYPASSASAGGGIYSVGTLTVIGSIFTGNIVDQCGGGIFYGSVTDERPR